MSTTATTRFYPTLTIWRDPGRTVLRIAHDNPGYRLLFLPVVAGFVSSPLMVMLDPGGSEELGWVWSNLLAFGPFGELAQLFVFGSLIQRVGARLGGRASVPEILLVLAWANLPIALFALPSLLAFAPDVVDIDYIYTEKGEMDRVTSINWWAMGPLVAMEFAAILLSCTILVRGLAVLQGFSARYAILSVFAVWGGGTGFLMVAAFLLGGGGELPRLLLGSWTEMFP
ncbi:MAG: YIP1 family protein [Pseudomonadota bacterium]